MLKRVTGRVDCWGGGGGGAPDSRQSTLCFMCTYVHVLYCVLL